MSDQSSKRVVRDRVERALNLIPSPAQAILLDEFFTITSNSLTQVDLGSAERIPEDQINEALRALRAGGRAADR